MSTEITYAKLHAPIFIPTIGNLKETLVDDLTSNTKGIKMTLENGLLRATLKGVTFLVPMTSVTHMVEKKSADATNQA
jgi:hypothetical protein